MPLTVWIFTMRRSRIIVLLVALGLIAMAVPVAIRINEILRFSQSVTHVADTIRSFDSRRPKDVPEAQWKEAVEWTANVIYQDFFASNSEKLAGLEDLEKELDRKARGDVDLGTLRWIWDACENACGGPDSYGIRFRRVTLLTKGAITDAKLPDVWSLRRCTNLDLSGTELTDESVPLLATLTQLKQLDIRGTRISEKGTQTLDEARRNCDIRK